MLEHPFRARSTPQAVDKNTHNHWGSSLRFATTVRENKLETFASSTKQYNTCHNPSAGGAEAIEKGLHVLQVHHPRRGPHDTCIAEYREAQHHQHLPINVGHSDEAIPQKRAGADKISALNTCCTISRPRHADQVLVASENRWFLLVYQAMAHAYCSWLYSYRPPSRRHSHVRRARLKETQTCHKSSGFKFCNKNSTT